MKKTLLIFLFVLMSLNAVYGEAVISHEELRFDLARTDPSPLKPGSTFDIFFDVTNIESYTIRNLQVNLVDLFPFSAVGKNESAFIIDELKAGQTKSIKFRFQVNKNINEGTYQLALQYYSNRISAIVSKTFDVSVRSTEVLVSTTKVRLNPEKVMPGGTFGMEVDIVNSAKSAINDISVELVLENSPFISLGSSSEQKIRQLSQDAIATLNFKLIANPDAELKAYRVPLNIVYYDHLGLKYTRNSTIGITVYAKPEYSIDLESSDVYMRSQVGEITLSIANKGNSELKYLNLELISTKDYEVISNPKAYIGNLESDDFETATFKIYTKSSKPVQLKLKAYYKDTYNNDFADSMNVTLPLYSKWNAQGLGLVERSTAWLNIILVIAVLIFLYKLYKVWKYERDLERSIIVLFKNTFRWIRSKLRL